MRRKELSVFWVNGYMEVRTHYIQAEHEVLRPDDGLEHAKILVGRLTLDRCLVETAEGIHDALLALARRRVNPCDLESVSNAEGKRTERFSEISSRNRDSVKSEVWLPRD
jgi:hypothetical protein